MHATTNDNNGVSPQKLGKLRGLSPQQIEREKNANKLKNQGSTPHTNDEDLKQLMTSPVRAKMQMQNGNLGSGSDFSGQSIKGLSAQWNSTNDGKQNAVRSWQGGKQLPQMTQVAGAGSAIS